MSDKYVDIIFPRPLRRSFTYRKPDYINNTLQTGQRVVVPLRNQETIGFVLSTKSEKPEGFELKDIIEVVDSSPIFPPELLDFLKRISNYYLTPLGKILKSTIPKEYRVKKNREISVNKDSYTKEKYQDIYQRFGSNNSLRYKTLRQDFERDYLAKGLNYLKDIDVLEEKVHFDKSNSREIIKKTIKLSENFSDQSKEKIPGNASQQKKIINYLEKHNKINDEELDDFSSYSIQSLKKKGLIKIEKKDVTLDQMWNGYSTDSKDVTLNNEQKEAYENIKTAISQNIFKSFLLFGVTGSGKTEVYIKLIKDALEQDKSALVLVPEITLTTHLASRFKGAFGADIAIWHSNLRQSYRSKIWQKILSREVSVVIGARSALFLPLQNLGLIVLDEEHDSSFKQSGTAPRYHARDAALMRGQKENATVVMGSATPSIESHYNSATQKFEKLELKERHSKASDPEMHVIDLKKNWDSGQKKTNLYTDFLINKIAEKFDRNEQILLLQNRRGYSNVLLCSDCGWTPECKNCDVTLTYHQTNETLVCHYCNYMERVPKKCPECGSSNFIFPGFGTQKAETRLEEIMPELSIQRLDNDTTRKKGALKNIFRRFENHKIDVLIGTQMIAKGLDFHNVTLVGVLNADIGLSLPDFRSRERVFQLLHQVSGRVGRGEIQGEVVIQTFQPDDFTIQCAVTGDIDIFKNREYSERNETNYPPFSRMASIIVSSLNQDRVKDVAQKSAQYLKQRNQNIEILGPTQAPIGKIQNRYRYLIILKSRRDKDPNGRRLRSLLNNFLNSQDYNKLSNKAKIIINIDPLDLL